jgi:uncharacterized membrane protein YczE
MGTIERLLLTLVKRSRLSIRTVQIILLGVFVGFGLSLIVDNTTFASPIVLGGTIVIIVLVGFLIQIFDRFKAGAKE